MAGRRGGRSAWPCSRRARSRSCADFLFTLSAPSSCGLLARRLAPPCAAVSILSPIGSSRPTRCLFSPGACWVPVVFVAMRIRISGPRSLGAESRFRRVCSAAALWFLRRWPVPITWSRRLFVPNRGPVTGTPSSSATAISADPRRHRAASPSRENCAAYAGERDRKADFVAIARRQPIAAEGLQR